jgi:nucleotide-binding universal stress UspA family protein
MPVTTPHAVVQATSKELQLKSVLVATDFAPTCDKAIRYAAAIARRYGSKFYLMHVVSSLGFAMAGPDALSSALDLAWRDAHRAETTLIQSGILKGLDHSVVVREGEIWPELDRVVRQKQINLMVVGTHSRRGLARLVLGSVAEQIFRNASCPVLTVGPNAPAEANTVISDPNRPILFATDLTQESLVGLPYAVSYANRRKTRLVLVHILPPVPHVDRDRSYTADDVARIRQQALQIVRHRLSELVSQTRLEIEPMCIAQYGDGIDEIVQTARELNAVGIVLGLKSHSASISHMPWSTAYQIVCGADCPVLTVRSQ